MGAVVATQLLLRNTGSGRILENRGYVLADQSPSVSGLPGPFAFGDSLFVWTFRGASGILREKTTLLRNP